MSAVLVDLMRGPIHVLNQRNRSARIYGDSLVVPLDDDCLRTTARSSSKPQHVPACLRYRSIEIAAFHPA